MTNAITSQDMPTPQTTRGRKPASPNTVTTPQFTPEAAQELAQDFDFARQVDTAVQDQTDIYRITGQLEAFNFMRKTVDVSAVILLRQVKESKKYRGLQIQQAGQVLTVSTWEEFCDKVIGRSYQHVDEDIRNLSALGEAFMEASQQMGLGYRQLRQLRALPDDVKGLMYDQDNNLRTNDPEILKDWVEEALAKNAKIKEELHTAQADLKARDKVMETKNKALDAAQTQLAKLKNIDPDAKIALMAEKEAKGREDLGALGAETLACFGKFLAQAVGIQSAQDISVAAAQDAHSAVSSLCSSMAEMLVANSFDVDFQAILYPEWMDNRAHK